MRRFSRADRGGVDGCAANRGAFTNHRRGARCHERARTVPAMNEIRSRRAHRTVDHRYGDFGLPRSLDHGVAGDPKVRPLERAALPRAHPAPHRSDEKARSRERSPRVRRGGPAEGTPQVKSAARVAGLRGPDLKPVEHRVSHRLAEAGIRHGMLESEDRQLRGTATGRTVPPCARHGHAAEPRPLPTGVWINPPHAVTPPQIAQ